MFALSSALSLRASLLLLVALVLVSLVFCASIEEGREGETSLLAAPSRRRRTSRLRGDDDVATVVVAVDVADAPAELPASPLLQEGEDKKSVAPVVVVVVVSPLPLWLLNSAEYLLMSLFFPLLLHSRGKLV